jgi:hypothetical protein
VDGARPAGGGLLHQAPGRGLTRRRPGPGAARRAAVTPESAVWIVPLRGLTGAGSFTTRGAERGRRRGNRTRPH